MPQALLSRTFALGMDSPLAVIFRVITRLIKKVSLLSDWTISLEQEASTLAD